MLSVVRGQQTGSCLFSRYLKTRCTILSRQACHILPLCIEAGRHCHSHLLSDRCCAGNPLWQAATSGRTRWETALRLKISPSHLMPARRTGKCVWRPLALFFISLWRTQPLHKHSLHDALSDCDGQLLTRFKCAGVTHTHWDACTNCTGHAEKTLFFSFLFVEMSGRTHHQRTDILLYDSLAHKQTWSWMWKRTLKQNQNKKQQCSHTSPQQDVLSKQTLFVSLWSVPQFTLVELQNWVARTGVLSGCGTNDWEDSRKTQND